MSTKKKVTRNPGRTRAKLLKSATALFSEKGYHGVSVDEIVSLAGVNKRMVYHYYGSKDDIYREALIEVYGRLESVEFAAVKKGKDPIEKLKLVMQAYYEFNEKNPDFVKMILWENLNNGEALKEHKNYFAKNTFLKKFAEIIDEGIQEGIFRKDINSKHLLIEFIGLCFIYYSNTFTLSSALNINLRSKRQRKEALNNALDLIFKGILSTNSHS